MLKKMLWEVGVYSCLPERLIGDGRDSAKRVVQETIPPNFSLSLLLVGLELSDILRGADAVVLLEGS